MSDFEKDQVTTEATETAVKKTAEIEHEFEESTVEGTEFTLNDDRRVKTLSPGRLVAKRFFRNRVAVFGLAVLTFMFLFSYLGGVLMPYRQDQIFYRYDAAQKRYAAIKENNELRYVVSEGKDFSSVARAKFVLAIKGTEKTFESQGTTFEYEKEGENFYSISTGGEVIAFAAYDIVRSSTGNDKLPFELAFNMLQAIYDKQKTFEFDGKTYQVDSEGSATLDGSEVAYASKYSIQAATSDIYLSRAFEEELVDALSSGSKDFFFKDADGVEAEYRLDYNPGTGDWIVMQETETKVFDTYSGPSKEHWLGTDRNGMDMLTRLMYGGRVSLYIGFIVVLISTVIGVIMGGMSGFFGGWVDMLIMRIVDIFYCIPSMPIIIILGSIMDTLRVDPQVRMIYLMLILGILGWAGTARMVRGQILSFREQEFMVAAEATGIRASRRIFRHLIPNVMPQLIVSMTMGLGSTIITEATLSFLGLGVKFPFASWGNIINDVNDTYVLTNYWFIWIPAGVLLLATVLAFNLVGDGLRDAFDPRMNR